MTRSIWLTTIIHRKSGDASRCSRRSDRVLFAILQKAGLKIFLTQDVLSYTPEMLLRIGTAAEDASAFLRELVDRCFRTFPEVAGIILRIGESDGLDVKGDFRSELVMRTATDVRRMLKELLPVFEAAGKTLIFRTWTVGAYSVGISSGIAAPWPVLWAESAATPSSSP